MPTNAEYVQLAKLAYETTGAPAGWDRLKIQSPANDAGYYGAAFRNVATGEIVVAHRGTELTSDQRGQRHLTF